MSARRTRRSRERTTAPVVLVYGEDRYDTSAIRHLLEDLVPALVGRIKALREPSIEIRDARIENLPQRSDRLAAAVRVEMARQEVGCVFAHEDCDAVEPAHEDLTERIESALDSLGCRVFAVTPAWEMEAWWFMWPEAVKAAHPTWRAPDDYVGKDVGRIRDAKEALRVAVIPRGLSRREKARFRTYAVSDAPRIAQAVRDRGEAREPQAQSASYDYFRARADRCADAL